jgi:hypothetical protein
MISDRKALPKFVRLDVTFQTIPSGHLQKFSFNANPLKLRVLSQWQKILHAMQVMAVVHH